MAHTSHTVTGGVPSTNVFYKYGYYINERRMGNEFCSYCFAKFVTRSPRFICSMSLLKSLYWLPVRYRNIFKVCTITCQTLSCTFVVVPEVSTNTESRASLTLCTDAPLSLVSKD